MLKQLLTIVCASATLASLVGGTLAEDSGGGSASRASDVEAIRSHIDTIFKGFINQDREAVRVTHSEDWCGFFRKSETAAKGIGDYMANADRVMGQPAHMVGYDMIEFDVFFHDDVAVVPYIAEVEIAGPGFTMKPNPILRVLDVYKKTDGEWIQVASHTTWHPKTQNNPPKPTATPDAEDR